MFFSCFCSNKKFMKENIISHDKIVKLDKTIKILNPVSNEMIVSKEFNEPIVTTSFCILYGKRYIIVCTKNIVYILDEELQEMNSIQFEEEILCSSSEKHKAHFYIGCKSGRISVNSIKYLNSKFICTEIYNFYCFKPVYSIAVHVDRINDEIRRSVYAGYSRWDEKALERIPCDISENPFKSRNIQI